MFSANFIFDTKQFDDDFHRLDALIAHPKHIEAKQRYSEWLSGYQVVISQVMRTYGDKTLQHPLVSQTA